MSTPCRVTGAAGLRAGVFVSDVVHSHGAKSVQAVDEGSALLAPACTDLQSQFCAFLSQIHFQWNHVCSVKSVMAGVFTPWKLAYTADQGYFSEARLPAYCWFLTSQPSLQGNRVAGAAPFSGSRLSLYPHPQPQARPWSLPKPPQHLPAWPGGPLPPSTTF